MLRWTDDTNVAGRWGNTLSVFVVYSSYRDTLTRQINMGTVACGGKKEGVDKLVA